MATNKAYNDWQVSNALARAKAIALLRKDGNTWAAIAGCFGITRQRAQKIYASHFENGSKHVRED